jgi:hypothetical protein
VLVRSVRTGKQHTYDGANDHERFPTFHRGRVWRAACESTLHMSQKTVQFVIGRLLTEEDLRSRFVERARETLDELLAQGYEMTEDEVDAIVRSDPAMWRSASRRIHPRLHRSRFR